MSPYYASLNNIISVTTPIVLPPNSQTVFTWTTFQAGNGATNGVWQFAGTTPTNFTLTSFVPLFQDTNFPYVNVRDPYCFRWVDNNGGLHYILTYTTHYTDPVNSPTPGPGVAVSTDDRNFVFQGYLNFGTNYFSQWSPKMFADATNGLHLGVALGSSIPNTPPTNAFICDISTTNFTQWSNLRWNDSVTHAVWYSVNGPEASSGSYVYTNGLYYYFSSGGEEFINTNLQSLGWFSVFATNDVNIGANAGSGPSILFSQGLWYWFTTDGHLFYLTSPDLTNWTPNIFTNSSLRPLVATNTWQEGSVRADQFATPPPLNQLPNSGQCIYPHQSGTNIYWSTQP